MLISQLSVFVENKPGKLSTITGVLAGAKIDIRALSIADTTDFGILRLIVDKPDEACKALQENGITVKLTSVIAVRVSDTPGALNEVLNILNREEIAVEYAYAFITRKDENAFVILRVENNDKAIGVLAKNNVNLLSQAEIFSV